MSALAQKAGGCGCNCGCGSEARPALSQAETGAVRENETVRAAVQAFHRPDAALSASTAPMGDRRLTIDFLYLDLSQCDPCRGALTSLEEAVTQVSEGLRGAGVDVEVRKIHVQSQEQAEALGFASSPTIRINGRDIQPAVRESHCSSCSALVGTDVSCRSWVDQGQEHSVPPPTLIIEALMRAISGEDPAIPAAHDARGGLPENLRRFFVGREEAPAAGCAAT